MTELKKRFEDKFYTKEYPSSHPKAQPIYVLTVPPEKLWQFIEEEIKQKDNLIEQLKTQAKCHAQESRTQHSIVLDIYKYFGIQKGDWNGSTPVKEKHEAEINNAKIDENKRWVKFLQEDGTNIIHASTLLNRIKELEKKPEQI